MQKIRLDNRCRIAMISDLHTSPDRPDITARLQRFLTRHGPHIEALFILGDLFEYWIGDDAAETCGHTTVESLLKDFADVPDKRLFIMHGNRDFLLGKAFSERVGGEIIDDPCRLDTGNAEVLLAHGDAYCLDDVEHQHFRQLTRQTAWQDAFLARSIDERIDFAEKARGQSEAGKREKSMAIMDVSPAAITQEFEENDIHWMIHGHTHRPAVHEYSLPSGTARRIVLGDWYDQQSHLELHQGRIHYHANGQVFNLQLD